VTISVRPATPRDRAAVGEILARGFPEKFRPLFGRDPLRTARILAELPPAGRVYVAERDGRIVGTLTLVLDGRPEGPIWPVLRRHLSWGRALWALLMLLILGSGAPEQDTALIEAVAVLPEQRRQGVGRALMERALVEAHRAGKRRAALYVVEDNVPARRLYESLGFRVERRTGLAWARPLFGARRVLYMVKDLRS
jgi:ribosomal protein S18 acetylase RimI-like enzyme